MNRKIHFHPDHLALGWETFQEMFSHLPKEVVKNAWNEANPKKKEKKEKPTE